MYIYAHVCIYMYIYIYIHICIAISFIIFVKIGKILLPISYNSLENFNISPTTMKKYLFVETLCNIVIIQDYHSVYHR